MDTKETGLLICDILSFKSDKISIIDKLKNLDQKQWNELVNFASRYKIAPLLYSKLLNYKNEFSIPSEIIESLHNAYMGSAARYASLYYEIKKLLTISKENNIDVILLKGAYIAEKFYEKPSLRPMCDIDILVKKENINPLFEVLLQKGYSTEVKYDRSFHLPLYTKNNTLIEVHWDISPHLYFPWKKVVEMDKLFKIALKEELFNMEILMVPVEYLIVYLCDKVVRDNFRGMFLLLYDISLIISKTKINWDKFHSVAIEWSSVKDVFCALFLAKNLYFANIPDNVFSHLNVIDFKDNMLEFIQDELFGTSEMDYSTVHFMQVINYKNLFTQLKNIFRPDNLGVLPNKNKQTKIRKEKFIFKRVQHLITQYKGILSFKTLRKTKDISSFYRWLKQ